MLGFLVRGRLDGSRWCFSIGCWRYGGSDGMDLVRKIIAGAAERLTDDGILMIEIGNERAYAEAAFGELGLTWLTTSAGDDMVFLLTAEQLKLV